MTTTVDTATEVRRFHSDVPEEVLDDLDRRIGATKGPERETVPDQSQGVPLRMIQDLARHWMTDDDWRRCESALNTLPQFVSEIEALDIRFLHSPVR